MGRGFSKIPPNTPVLQYSKTEAFDNRVQPQNCFIIGFNIDYLFVGQRDIRCRWVNNFYLLHCALVAFGDIIDDLFDRPQM